MRLFNTFRLTAALSFALTLVQPVMAQDITLTNYTFSPGKQEIGQVVARPSRQLPAKVKLKGKHARLFSLDKDNKLSFRKNLSAHNQQTWYDVVFSYKSQGKMQQDTFRLVKDEFIRNRVIAHRGAWKNTGATENSIAALQHAIRLGCAGSEFDAHLSADSVIFILHDPQIQHIGIETSPAAQLHQIKLANGENLPTLAAHLQEGLKQNKTRLILELKPSVISKERSLALARKAVALVAQYRAQGWVDYISFDYDILKQVLALDPYAEVAYLKGDKDPEALSQDKFYGLDYHFSVLQKNPQWLQQAHQKKLTINVWTVNDPVLMDWFLEKKADFITTNEPEMLLEKIKSKQ